MALSENEELELLTLERQKAMAGGSAKGPDTRGLGQKAWNALAVPEQLSQQGLNQIAQAVPGYEPQGKPGLISKTLKAVLPISGILPQGVVQDVGMNFPKVGAETLAKAAPGFVNRASLLTAGAGAAVKFGSKIPAIISGARDVGAAVEGAAGQGENLAAMKPGTLKAIFQQPSALFKNSKKAASALYETAKSAYSNRLSELTDPKAIIVEAQKLGNSINPWEAKIVSRAIESQLGGGADENLYMMKRGYDAISHSDQTIAQADKLHALGSKIESAQKLLPQNKTGGVSVIKLGEAGALAAKGGPLGAVAGAQFSPMVQGLEAAGAGALNQGAVQPIIRNPAIGAGVGGILPAILEALGRRRTAMAAQP